MARPRRPATRHVTLENLGTPPEARIAGRTVMRAEWVDPADIKPNASRTAARVTGWRTYCPLRRMYVNPSSGITDQHIMAADKLREMADLVLLGASAGSYLVFIAHMPGPSQGPGPAQLRRVVAYRAVRRALKHCTFDDLLLLDAVVMRNKSLYAWTQTTGERIEKVRARLISLLDKLAEHFDSEIREEVDKGRRLPL